jgi:hypothetical protein
MLKQARSNNRAFITFRTDTEAAQARKVIHHHELQGHKLFAVYSQRTDIKVDARDSTRRNGRSKAGQDGDVKSNTGARPKAESGVPTDQEAHVERDEVGG